MKSLKLFSIIAIAAIMASCQGGDPTTIKFTSADQVSVGVGENLNFDVTVKVTNGKGETTFAFEGLPEWVTKTPGTNKVTLTGTAPTAEQTFAVTIKATNNKETTTQNFKINVGGGVINPDGDGTETKPYNVTGAKANQGSPGNQDYKYVTGYIVGYAWAGTATEYYFSADTCNQQTNILIAASPTETNSANVLTVQLPSGAVRTGINLKGNPSVLGKEVLLAGTLEAYFGVPGLKNTCYAKLIESGTEFGQKPLILTGTPVLDETLLNQASFDKFTAVSVVGTQVWTSTTYGASMSGYASGASNANEDWLITPALDMTGKEGSIYFEHTRGPAASINVGVSSGWYTVLVSNNYTSGDPNSATWAPITFNNAVTAAWGFIQGGKATIPASNMAPNCRVAFKYICSATESATWELRNVKIY